MSAVGTVSYLLGTGDQRLDRADGSPHPFTDQASDSQLWEPHSVTPQEQPTAEPTVKLSALPRPPGPPSHFTPLPKFPDQRQADSTNHLELKFPTIKPLPKLEKIQTRPLPALDKQAPPAPEQKQEFTNTRRLPSIESHESHESVESRDSPGSQIRHP